MRISSYLLGFLATSSAALLPGCGDAPPTVTGGTNDISGDGDDEGGECKSETEAPCPCPDGQPDGLKYCYEGKYLACSCDKDENGGSTVAGSDCKPGRYEGEFFGYYFSSYTGATSPIPVWALGGLDGKPGLAFTLNAKGDATVEAGSEFAEELEISDGYVKGTADGLFPFEGKLTGSLNCRTKEFKARLTGGYAVLIGIPGITTADFDGPVYGKYDIDSSSFPCQNGAKKFPKCDDDVPLRATAAVADAVAGTPYPNKKYPSTWELLEKTTLMSPYKDIPLGGKGYWSAQWVGEGSVNTSNGMETKP